MESRIPVTEKLIRRDKKENLSTMGRQSASDHLILLVGDSDISRWPKRLLPQPTKDSLCLVSGHSGSTLGECLPFIAESLSKAPSDRIILVVCAGENDIGSCSLAETETSFRRLLEMVFALPHKNVSLIFLGPKLEPWLVDDKESRKSYIHMSRSFERICNESSRSSEIVYIDCLTMFCGETARLPGALFGGGAVADAMYFDSDLLHLSEQGYEIWRNLVKDCIVRLI
jgi:lysophospholipase L1-like esterase